MTIQDDLLRFAEISAYLDSDELKTIRIPAFEAVQYRMRDLIFALALREEIYIEMMAAAFLKQTEIPANECELVMERTFDGGEYKFYYRRRDDPR